MNRVVKMTGPIGAHRAAAVAMLALSGAAAPSTLAQPSTPVYTVSFADCVTIDNRFRGPDGVFWWDVDPGCDIYQIDTYERPMTQEFQLHRRRYGAKEYFEYLDITQAKAGYDSKYLYVAIDLAGRNHRTSGGDRIPKGMVERYGFRISTDPDGRHGVLLVADQPELKNEPKTRFGPIGTFGYVDTNGDVGGADTDGPTGLTVTKSDNPDEEDGMNGYDRVIISDGRLEGGPVVLWTRINPTDRTVVELAVDYRAIGFTAADLANLAYFDIEAIKGGPKDPQNYLWNDKYTKQEAGSPNKGSGGMSEFGTVGCLNIYEVDTVRGGPIHSLRGDYDGDGTLSAGDVAALVIQIGTGGRSADFNADGSVDSLDVADLVREIGGR